MMRRRTLIVSTLAIMVMPPILKASQQAEKVWRIALVSPAAGPNPFVDAFRKSLRHMGYFEDRNLAIDYVWMAGEELYREVVPQLAKGTVDVIVTEGNAAAFAAKSATSRTPIVALNMVDPVGSGLVASIARPGGNLTGYAFTPDINAKMIKLLREAVPRLKQVAALWNSGSQGSRLYLDAVHQAARSIGIVLKPYDVRRGEDIDVAFRALHGSVDGLMVFPEPLLSTYRRRIIDAAQMEKLPAIFGDPDAAQLGALMSYSPDVVHLFRRGAAYVHRIIMGEKPEDLPVQQPTTFDLIINVKTAKALDIAIPATLLAHADDVIE
jgi:putative tryptophan/tyrosine transport system substrate-binding protein